MIPTRVATPASRRYATQEATSAIASYRNGPLSAFTNFRPKPDDPRTFGANTAMPCAASDWNNGPCPGRSCASGPPWNHSTVGCGPGVRGRNSQPVSSRPSCAVNVSSVGRYASASARTPDTTCMPASSSVQTPWGWAGPSAVNVSVDPSADQLSPLSTPPGSGSTARAPIGVRMTSSDRPPRWFHSTAIWLPAGAWANDSTSAVSEAASTSTAPSSTLIRTGYSPASLSAYTVRPSGPKYASWPLVTYSSTPVASPRQTMGGAPRGPTRSSARSPSGLRSSNEPRSPSATPGRVPASTSTTYVVVRFSVTVSSER